MTKAKSLGFQWDNFRSGQNLNFAVPVNFLKTLRVTPQTNDTSPPKVSTEYDQAPRFLKQVDPEYPEAARRARIEGTVVLEFTIGIDGQATDIKVIQSLGFGCDEASIKTIKEARFIPAKRNNVAVPVRVRLPIRFFSSLINVIRPHRIYR